MIDQIIGQIDDAFKMPYYDVSTNQERFINAFYIITSKYFTENAQEKIKMKLTNPAIRHNVYFFDGEKIKDLLA